MTQQQTPATPEQECAALGNQIDKINSELSQLEERASDLNDAKQQAIGIRNYLQSRAQLAEQQAAAIAEATGEEEFEPEEEVEVEDETPEVDPLEE